MKLNIKIVYFSEEYTVIVHWLIMEKNNFTHKYFQYFNLKSNKAKLQYGIKSS